jgi:transposase
VVLTWCKRIWRCEQRACPARTWSEQHPAIRPRSVLSERAAWWATEQVGRRRRTVAAVARELGGAAWRTVMRAVRRHGQPLVDDPARLTGVDRLGVDEHALLRATARHATQFATGIIDTTGARPARLLDVVPGRTGSALSRWLSRQEPVFREQITVASLDPFRGYAVRHEAPYNRVGCKDPPPVCRSRPVKLRAA